MIPNKLSKPLCDCCVELQHLCTFSSYLQTEENNDTDSRQDTLNSKRL